MTARTRSRFTDYFILVFITLVWGLSWPFTVVGLKYCDPLLLASLRCLLGGGALALWRKRSATKESFDRKAIAVSAIVGVFWVGVPTALCVWALQYISGGLGAILQSTVPFFVAIVSHFYLKENQLDTAKISGLLIGFLGIIVLFSGDQLNAEGLLAIVGGVAVIIASVSNGFAQGIFRKHFKGSDQVGFNMYMQLFGGIAILPVVFLRDAPKFMVSTELIVVLVFLSIFATAVPFTLYFDLFRRVDIVVLSMMAYVIPVVAVGVGIVWLGERLTPTDIAGSALVLLGVLLATQYSYFRAKFFNSTAPANDKEIA
ncbi:MAG: DMT family transporter [Ignavibacteriales bacterium]|nr:DMT family transporter [Ignavibacteriales bacterium]